jgi:hypothetical protein
LTDDGNQDRAIGRIEGKLDLIIAEQERAALARKVQYEKLDALDRKVDKTDNKVASIDNRLEVVEAPVAEFSRWKERAIGAIMLISFVSAVSGAMIVALWKKMWTVFGGN